MSLIALFVLLVTSSLKVYAGDIDPSQFDQLVLNDSRVWVVEFYSPMCGSCSEFAPTWEALESKFKSVQSGKINIDKKEGLAIAKQFGVLEEGLPNIRLFASKESKSISIMSGEPKSTKELMSSLKRNIKGLSRRDDGHYLKSL